MKTNTHAKQLAQLIDQGGLLRPRDVAHHGIAPVHFQRLVETGQLERVSRGVYRPANSLVTEHHGLAIVAARVPKGIVCLLSALQFHNLGTQLPHEVWLSIGRRAGTPRIEFPPTRLVRLSGNALHVGIEEYDIEGIPVRVFSPAKTVADCFKFRNQVGLDVALEALREYRRERRGTMDELWRMAQACRVAKVMLPYLQAIV